jgi:hypothetical protein
LDDLDGELQRIEHLRVALLSVESPLSGHYCFTEAIADLDDDMMDNGLSYGSRETAARRRQEFYRQAGLRVKVGEELEISLGVDGSLLVQMKVLQVVFAAPRKLRKAKF